MSFEAMPFPMQPLAGAVPVWHARIVVSQLLPACRTAQAQGGRLAALWATDERDSAAGGLGLQLILANPDGALWLSVPLDANAPEYPDLSGIFACAIRPQRAAADLIGIRAVAPAGAPYPADGRPWLRHASWPADVHPLRRDFAADTAYPTDADHYAFVPVDGEGVHEIPVGPVHAGIIEPGHFRFSVVGEKVLRLEERLGYKHKGISRRFSQLPLAEGARLAGRISGDSTVAYAWAYSMALEAMAGTTPPARALWLRALLLERERVANHLGDLGALGNDGGLAFGLAQFMRLKEDVLRLNARLFGHRYLMDSIVPGGVSSDPDSSVLETVREQCDLLEREIRVLKEVYDEHSGLQDRFLTCGRLTAETARHLGVVGFAARASGLNCDARVQPGVAPYDQLKVKLCGQAGGDVAARVAIRFEELFESLRLTRSIIERISPGAIRHPVPTPASGSAGIGWVEGWRGEVLVALRAGDDGSIRFCHTHDPSWQNWPALEYAVIGNIVPDFPLINKSFNLSYSGQDL